MAYTAFLALCLLGGAKAADFDVWYVNVDGEDGRAKCMDRQIEAVGLQPRRFSAVQVNPCGDGSGAKLKACFEKQGAGDCVKSGMENRFLFDYDQETHRLKTSETVRIHILSDTCSHKRLFSQIGADNSSSPYVLVLEDDAVLNQNRLKEQLSDFIENYKGKYADDWQLVQIDPYGNHCAEHIVGHHGGRNVMLPRNLWKQGPGMKKPIKGGRTCSQYFGSQALLVRKDKANEIVEFMESNPTFPLDWLAAELPRGLAWTAGLAMNPRKIGKMSAELKQMCDKDDLMKSSINSDSPKPKKKIELKAKKWPAFGSLAEMSDAAIRVEMEADFEDLEDTDDQDEKTQKKRFLQN